MAPSTTPSVVTTWCRPPSAAAGSSGATRSTPRCRPDHRARTAHHPGGCAPVDPAPLPAASSPTRRRTSACSRAESGAPATSCSAVPEATSSRVAEPTTSSTATGTSTCGSACAPTGANGPGEIGCTDLMTGLCGRLVRNEAGMTLQQAIFASMVNPGNIVAVREILKPQTSEVRTNYEITVADVAGEKVITVNHTGGGDRGRRHRHPPQRREGAARGCGCPDVHVPHRSRTGGRDLAGGGGSSEHGGATTLPVVVTNKE